MRLLILSQYYPPETGAPQNRLHELAIRLKEKGVDVEVFTAMPNYPKMEIFSAYKGKKYLSEDIDGLLVHRSWIYVKNSKSIFHRLLNYFSFVFSSLFYGLKKLNTFDYILVESPPLFLGISAIILSRFKKAKMIFNVSDLWPESAEKLGLVQNKVFLGAATWLEEFCYRNAVLITGQTQGIVSNIQNRFPAKKIYWLPNGVDLKLFNPDEIQSSWRAKEGLNENDLLFFYGGIIGHAQGLEVVINAASLLKDLKHIKFILLGDGPMKEELVGLKNKLQVDNVRFMDPVGKKDIPEIVKAIDVALIPLKKIPLFEGAIPSKIFENLAMKIPLLLGVDGEARELFINQGKAGYYFEPENHADLASKIVWINEHKENLHEMGENGREFVLQNFNRDTISANFLNVLKTINE